MQGSRVQRVALDRALALPGATLEWPFGPDWDVVKVRGKVFLLMAELRGQPIVILKADPVDARLLCQDLAEVTPGYHMNKRHWITLSPGPGLDEALVQDLVTDSYLLVVAGLPRAQQPVDPERFGLGSAAPPDE
ncbi:MAG: MmcQ/YjbR family DNA-binding protein [Propionibacteriaceae bacterium]|jgi:predicted DNA-binding protein (MmcQ/YjbR family)|nr:MmcQ/YjbR family DNA-binding protein [Propionibacteriaceae bacterium]